MGRREGLPFSDYDKEDLTYLCDAELNAIAALNGVSIELDRTKKVQLLLKTGKKNYKVWRKARPKSQIPIYLPMLLNAVARLLVSSEG